ncbi:MAG: lipid-A-disaccharide synthase [Deltaproteobacteria bacterium]|nr:MAG: lipid-A-disaccharide synthase [Deltaproteobacteria bacterium]
MKGAVPSLLVVAGESSADRYAAAVLARLRDRMPDARFFGLGLERLSREGLECVADVSELGVVGITEAFSAVGAAFGILKVLSDKVKKYRPSAALLVDLPSFNLHLAQRLRRMGVGVVWYVAPQLWAWRTGRIRKLRRRVDRLCVVLPFEEEFFRKAGIDARYVGHPLVEFQRAGKPERPYLVLLLPGSRNAEIERMLEPMVAAAGLLGKRHPHLRFVCAPAIEPSRRWFDELCSRHRAKVELAVGEADRLLCTAGLAWCASGTISLQAAMAGVPQVVVYRLSWLSWLVANAMVKVPWASLVNILAGRQLVPELLQGNFTPESLASHSEVLLWGPERARVTEGYRQVRAMLGSRNASDAVADTVLEVMNAGR